MNLKSILNKHREFDEELAIHTWRKDGRAEIY